jgi:uncharacterized protein YecT (DUF1311 family)
MRTRLLFTLIIIVVFTGGSTLPSQDEPPIRPEIVGEAGRYEQADAELNRAYKEMLNHLDKDQQELLRKAERAWLIMRDAQAELAVSRTGGWGRTAGYYSKLATLTRDRIRDLQKLFSDE